MAEHKFALHDGITLVEKTHTACVVREPKAGDLIDAQQDAERLMATPSGYALVVSDSLLGWHLARRQIVAIGDIKGPISETDMRELSGRDLDLIQSELNKMDKAVAEELAKRGRNESPGATD